DAFPRITRRVVAGPSLLRPHADARRRVRRLRDCHHRAWHRRECDRLQRRQRTAGAPAAIRRSGGIGLDPERGGVRAVRTNDTGRSLPRLRRADPLLLRPRRILRLLRCGRHQAEWTQRRIRLSAVPVSQTFFATLGVHPIYGRLFNAAECSWNGPKAAMLSYALWERRVSGDPGIVGKPITLHAETLVVGGGFAPPFAFASGLGPGVP